MKPFRAFLVFCVWRKIEDGVSVERYPRLGDKLACVRWEEKALLVSKKTAMERASVVGRLFDGALHSSPSHRLHRIGVLGLRRDRQHD